MKKKKKLDLVLEELARKMRPQSKGGSEPDACTAGRNKPACEVPDPQQTDWGTDSTGIVWNCTCCS